MTTLLLPPSVMPVIILRGSDYEMGYQYGQQAAPYLDWKRDALWAEVLREWGNREQVAAELTIARQYIKDSTPNALEGLNGMADGATAAGYHLAFLDCLLFNAKPKKLAAPDTPSADSGTGEAGLPGDGCSSWSAWGKTTGDGRLLCAKSSDAEFEAQATIIAFPDQGHSYLATAPLGELAETPCMNDQGLFMASSGGFALRPVDFDHGISSTCGYQHLLRFAENAAQALETFLGWKYPRCTNVHFADVTGDAYVAEITAALKSVRRPGDFGEKDFLYATNNYFKEEMKDAIAGDRFIEHGGWLGGGWSISSISRNLQIWNMLHNYSGRVDREFAKMMWRFPGNPPPAPLDAEAYYRTRGAGWDQKIGNQFNRRVAIMQPDRGKLGVAHICTGTAGRNVHPLHPGGQCFPIHPTYSFYQIALATSPEEVIEAARLEALACLGAAHRAFGPRNSDADGQAALTELFSLAKAEYHEGIHLSHKAAVTWGNEALLYASRAASAFTRTQAHAKQVRHAFVPPAETPADLGLQPYNGSWASWASKGRESRELHL